MSTKFRINISRPDPGTNENEEQISFIEPLRKDERIFVNNIYLLNLDQYYNGQPAIWGPGFRYEFEFNNLEDATAFKLRFGGTQVEI